MIFYIEEKNGCYEVCGSSYSGHFYIATCSTQEEANKILERLQEDSEKWE